MKTAEEILTKLKRLDLILVNSIQIRLGQTFPWKHLGERNEFQNKWRKRIEQYKINILTTWKEDICKKQREICADKYKDCYFTDIVYEITYDSILTTSKP